MSHKHQIECHDLKKITKICAKNLLNLMMLKR